MVRTDGRAEGPRPYPFRFAQNYSDGTPTHIFIIHEATIHTYRQIFMDGRQHPAELDPTWFGHSIGRFDGKDTLVIDTVGFNDKFWFDPQGHAAYRAVAHHRAVVAAADGHAPRTRVTIDDPGAFSKPFTVTFPARLSAPGDEIMEHFCAENNQYGVAGGHKNPLSN